MGTNGVKTFAYINSSGRNEAYRRRGQIESWIQMVIKMNKIFLFIGLVGGICVISYLLIAHSSKEYPISANKDGNCEIIKSKVFVVGKDEPIGERETCSDYIVQISPSGNEMCIVYTSPKTQQSFNGEGENHYLRIVATEDKKAEDYPIPSLSSLPYPIIFSTLNPPMWSPNEDCILLYGNGGTSNRGFLWLFDKRKKKVSFLCETVSDKLVKIYQPWSKEGDAVLVAHRGKDSQEILLCIREIESGKEKEIARLKVTPSEGFNPWFPVKGKIFALWDQTSGNIYFWVNEKGVFALSPNQSVPEKIFGPLPNMEEWAIHDSLLYPNAMWMLFEALWKQDVAKNTLLPSKEKFCIFDLKSSKFVYTTTASLGSSELFPSISAQQAKPFPYERVFLVHSIPSEFAFKRIRLIDLRKSAREMEIELPIPESERIWDIQWGKDIYTLLVVTTNKSDRRRLEFFKLYQLKIKY